MGDTRTILVTGGAGFVGSNLAVAIAGSSPGLHVIAFDNLYRSGSELNLGRLERAGVEFVKGDVREPTDLARFENVDAIVECSAEPSVLSGTDGDTSYLFETNLTGAFNCLELARRADCQMIFLSSSRVYPLARLRSVNLIEGETRFELATDQPCEGWSTAGVAETMPVDGPRTLYGTTKLSAEMLCAEYADQFGLPIVVNRCGVIAGPWQMGRVDQGVFTHWMLAHEFNRPVSYIGFGGSGKQVRDLLHVDDLTDLVELQLESPEHWSGRTFNVGGGREVSLSLREATEICTRLTGTELKVGSIQEERTGDMPLYLSDCSKLFEFSDWRPKRDVECILTDIQKWIASDRETVGRVLS